MSNPLRIKLYNKKLQLEDKYILDSNMPDWLANPLFRLGDAYNRVCCTFLGHQWDGWRNKPGMWCLLCDKLERRGNGSRT